MPLHKWLNRPYPLIQRTTDKLILVIGFALFTYLFLLLYQPFGASRIEERDWFLLGFGFSVLIALAFNYFLLPVIFRHWFDPEKWQIKKEIIYISWSFVLIATLNYLHNSTVGKEIAPQFGLLSFLGITFSVDIFPLLGLIFITELYFNKKKSGS